MEKCAIIVDWHVSDTRVDRMQNSSKRQIIQSKAIMK